MPLSCHLYLCRSDNYGVLVREETSGQTALIDVPDEMATRQAIDETGWEPTHIFLTHHHHDHIDGVGGIRSSYPVSVVGHAADSHRLPRLDVAVHEGDTISLGDATFEVIDTPGHTVGHIAFVCRSAKLAFVGDTLFTMGCGRMFEGTPDQFFASLQKLAALDPQTLLYCGHEYTQANAAFAVARDGDNAALADHARAIDAKRAKGHPTVPSVLSDELAFNPFLQVKNVEDFAALRAAKDAF